MFLLSHYYTNAFKSDIFRIVEIGHNQNPDKCYFKAKSLKTGQISTFDVKGFLKTERHSPQVNYLSPQPLLAPVVERMKLDLKL